MNNLTKRIIAGIFGIPLIIGASYLGGIYFLILSVIISGIALWELFTMSEKKSLSPLKITGIIFSTAVIILSFLNNGFIVYFPFIIILLLSIEIFRSEKNPMNAVILVFGLIYITLPFILLNMMIKNQSGDYTGFNIVIYIFALIWICDSSAYFGGRIYGKRQLSPISPKKTIEGAITGFVMTAVVSVLIHFIFPEKINITDAAAIGVMVGIFSQTGDLFESMLKRYFGVKDSSEIIPGHGGVLDRFDSLIFVTPVIYAYLSLKNYC